MSHPLSAAIAIREVQSSVFGRMLITATEHGVCSVDWGDEALNGAGSSSIGEKENATAAMWAEAAKCQLEEYFAGKRQTFDLPLDLHGTEFQRDVWQALCDIPYGETRTYGEIAKSIGREKAVRAVGQANRVNPVTVIVPCHRVVGSNGSLTGYAGSQVHLKERLLQLECAQLPRLASAVNQEV